MKTNENFPISDRLLVTATGLSGMVGSRVQATASTTQWQPLDVDITDQEATKRAVKNSTASVIVNFAGFTDVTKAWEERGDKNGKCYKINVNGVQNLANACAKYDKFLIHISTDYVFKVDKTDGYTEHDLGDTEEDWYGVTKRIAEEEVRKILTSYAIVRIASPFQVASDRKEDVVRRSIRQLKEHSLPPMFTDTIITPLHVDDLTPLLETLALHKATGTFHGVGSTSLSPFSLATLIAQIFDLDDSQVQEGYLDNYTKNLNRPYPRYLKLDNSWTKETLGIELHPIEESLKTLRSQIDREDS